MLTATAERIDVQVLEAPETPETLPARPLHPALERNKWKPGQTGNPYGRNGKDVELLVKERTLEGVALVDFWVRCFKGAEPGTAGPQGLKHRKWASERLANRLWGKERFVGEVSMAGADSPQASDVQLLLATLSTEQLRTLHAISRQLAELQTPTADAIETTASPGVVIEASEPAPEAPEVECTLDNQSKVQPETQADVEQSAGLCPPCALPADASVPALPELIREQPRRASKWRR